ncbi:Protein of unknown function DUF1638 [Desulfofarcimen acetoxidans DSM 771]|jgi:hypothetical protein|uniref:DUF1638 domain-containing protein n=1 Tax=Desulfofarcimen acetoxidans (strain ATCC 49208 / DSM 771 / KCTC 5769 / VKM B-1644 / 5575) TaxID=485916 RepID=C8VYA0_DESAS|nr:DUF1638 domain-containing protein [Desulfofarcimen acetoxidans]ACV62781.1 Protein of unknown function DUF1638 [Desulfofarcimen acetoxidans DSM 771]
MCKKILACGIIKQELDYLLKDKEVEINYIDPALHVDLNRLKDELSRSMDQMNGDTFVVLGAQCHPEIENMVAERGGQIIKAKNCIDMLFGNKMAETDAEARTFYLTSGWLENWRKIFVEGLKWDEIDARQNFGFYDRILLLDTGISPINDEAILEFFEYTQVPIEIITIELDNLAKLLE